MALGCGCGLIDSVALCCGCELIDSVVGSDLQVIGGSDGGFG